jgi:hypothetical protein
MRNPGLLAGLLFLASGASRAGEPLLANGDMPGLAVTATTPYEGKALYGYIDGGADLYREYGFVRLNVQAVKLDSEEISVEIYHMADDSAAFGIYSVSVAEGARGTGAHAAATAYQALFASGPFFVRVVNFTGTPEAKARTAAIARVLLKRMGGTAFSIPGIFGRAGIGRLRYVRGPLGMQNSEADWADVLEGLDPYTGYFAVAAEDSGRIAMLRFPTPASADTFASRFTRMPQSVIRREGGTQVLAVEGPERFRSAVLGTR